MGGCEGCWGSRGVWGGQVGCEEAVEEGLEGWEEEVVSIGDLGAVEVEDGAEELAESGVLDWGMFVFSLITEMD